MKLHTALLAGVLLASAACAKDITISPGDSLAKARDRARSGDRILLHGGTYRLNETLRIGAHNSGVTWRAYQDEKPVLSGGVPVTGWTPGANGQFKATVKVDNFRQLWVNGQRAQRARGAVPANLKPWGKHEAAVRKGALPPGLTGTPGYLPGTLENIAPAGYTTIDANLANWKNPQDIEFGYYNSWTHMIAKIEKITPSTGGATIEMSQPGFFLCHRKGGTQAGQPAYMENALELLDQPGEWYFDRPARTIYYLPRPGEVMAQAEVIAPRLETLVEVKGAHDVKFEGITFAHATWLRPSTRMGHPDVQANFIQPVTNSYWRPEGDKGWVPVNGEQVKSPANVVVDAARGVCFEKCTFTALGGAGLDLQHGAQSNVVSGCHFSDISGSGIQIGDITREDHHPSDPGRVVKANRVVNNLITRIGVEYTDAAGVVAGYTEASVIAHNEIFDIPYSGISAGWGWGMPDAGGSSYVDPIKWSTPTAARNNRIEFNHIHDLMRQRNDGGGVYTLGRQPGTIIRGNHIHDAGPGAPGGVYLDEGSADIEVTGNLIYRVPRALQFNNHNQNRIATCPVRDNYFAPGATTTAGLAGRALKAGSALDVPHEPRLDPAQFTMTAWIRLDKYPTGKDARRWVVCRAPNEHADGNLSLFVDGRNVSAYLNVGGGPANCFAADGAGDPLPLDKWTPVALTYDGDTLRVYCTGKEAAARKIGKVRTPGKGPLTIGARTDRFSTFDCGDIDEVRLYNRALAPAEIQNLPQDGLVQLWDFEKIPGQDAATRIAAQAGLEPPYNPILK